MSVRGYEFKLVEWPVDGGTMTELVVMLNEYGKQEWQLAHIHEMMRDRRVVLLIFMQRPIYEEVQDG